MKSNLLFLVFSFLFLTGQAQGPSLNPQRQAERDSIYSLYREHIDTMTVNTWLNIMTLNRYLRAMSALDSLLYPANKTNQPVTDSAWLALEETNTLLKDRLAKALAVQQTSQEKYQQAVNTLLYVSIGSGILILVLLILIIIYFNKNAKNRQALAAHAALESKLQFAGDEIAKLQRSNGDLLAKNRSLQSEFSDEIAALRADKESLGEEKLMLENQIIEVKKAWEMEVQKRMESEAAGADATSAKRSDRRQQKHVVGLQEEIKKLHEQIKEQLNRLENSQQQLDQEISFRKLIEKELKDLKENYLPEPGTPGDTEGKLTYRQLWEAKKELTQDLAQTRKNLEKEVKTRLAVEADLRNLLEKLKNKYL